MDSTLDRTALLESLGFLGDKVTDDSHARRGTFTGLPSRTDEFKFREEYQEAIRLKALGCKTRDIARELNLSYHHVQQAISCPFGQRMLADLQGARNSSVMDIQSRIQGMCGDALDFIEGVLDGEIESTTGLKFKVVESVLDRAGHGKITKNLNLGLSGSLTADDIEQIKVHARESGLTQSTSQRLAGGLECESTVDVVVVEVESRPASDPGAPLEGEST